MTRPFSEVLNDMSGGRVALDLTAAVTEVTKAVEKTGKLALTIPQKIKLGIPVYFGDEPYEVWCFFRHRITDGKLTFQIKMQGRELLVQDAFMRKAASVAGDTRITVRFGSPVA